MDVTIDKVETMLVGAGAAAGDDTVFVTVHGGGRTGWYGPVSEPVGRAVDALSYAAIGHLVTDHDGHRARLQVAAGGLVGSVAEWAVGAVDCALWDLHGRLADRPVADLLAPPASRSSVPAYASWLRVDLSGPPAPGVPTQVADEGWAFTKWGLRRRPDATTATEASHLLQSVDRAAEILGKGFAVDAVGTWSPELATAFAKRFDNPALTWLEDPLPEHYLRIYHRLANAGLPVAVGERLRPDEDLPMLFDQVRPKALTIDVVGCGGLTRAVEITAAARKVGVPVYPHGRSMVPGIHLAAAFPDAVPAVEYRRQWEPRRQTLYAEPWTPDHGHLPSPRTPGLGTQPRRPQ
ncbi:enolase C-terminal domain-like protein [Kitasatospora sp. NPDC048538]|uniref:enolase C-terminal domain-like protein n=1 Tax=unclassified Kitasatospora TaxID=2633591 RepID=UPI003407F766